MPSNIYLLSCHNLTDYIQDEKKLILAFKEKNINAITVPWPDYHPNKGDVVIVRTTWDYRLRHKEFLHKLTQIVEGGAHLYNPLPAIFWNIEKSYLLDLQKSGIPIIPTKIWKNGNLESLRHTVEMMNCTEFIVKPVVGAGGFETYRLNKKSFLANMSVPKDIGRQPMLVQEFLSSVITKGENSLIFFNAQFSHALQKIPSPGEFRVQEKYGATLVSVKPKPDELALAQKILSLIPHPCLYARVDLIRDNSNAAVLMELELIEPSLYFRMDDRSPERFVTSTLELLETQGVTSSARRRLD